MNIESLRLKKILKEFDVLEQDFEYAGIVGKAEVLGWKIIFFRKLSDLEKTVAISFDDIIESEEKAIANNILEVIKFDIKFGDSYEIIQKKYGKPYTQDNIYKDTCRYHYLIKPNFFLSFGIKDKQLAYLEIILDKEIIDEVLSAR